MIDSRDPCCPRLEPGETIFLVIRPETSSGKSRPRGALLQFVVVIWSWLYSVGRRRRNPLERESGVNNVTLPNRFYIAYSQEDSIRWAVWLGRYTFEKISKVLKVRLISVRNGESSANAKVGLIGQWKASCPKAKAWVSDTHVGLDGCMWHEKSYPGDRFINVLFYK